MLKKVYSLERFQIVNSELCAPTATFYFQPLVQVLFEDNQELNHEQMWSPFPLSSVPVVRPVQARDVEATLLSCVM